VRFVEVLLPIGWVAYTVWVTISRWRYKRLVAISNDWHLALTRHERREYARELRDRERAQYTDDVYRHLAGGLPPLKGDVNEK
jgi:predicted glycosyl hydrolase (DUF1957 family)